MKRLWFVLTTGIGALAMVASVGMVSASAAPEPHSDQVITVSKTAAGTGAPLAGAVFTLYPWHGSCDLSAPVATATSDSSGRAVFSLEGHHNYCVAETTAPAGYQLPGGGPQVVKTTYETNGKGSDHPACVKESEAIGFVDTLAVTPSTTSTTSTTSTMPTSTTTTTIISPSTAAGGGAATPEAAVNGATTVHTGLPWAGSKPYALGALTAGGALFGAGLLMRRRRVLR